MGRESMAVSAHVGKWKRYIVWLERVSEKFGRIDILVNNAVVLRYWLQHYLPRKRSGIKL